MGNYWLDLYEKEKIVFKGKFKIADDAPPKGRMYALPFLESQIQKLEFEEKPRSLKEKISIENMEDAMIIYRLTRESK